jgi:putative flippase GtrA
MTAALTKALKSVFPALVGMLLVLGVIAANGRPSVFTDSDNYYSQGRNVVEGVGAFLFPDTVARAEAPADAKVVARERVRMKYKHTSMAARSPFYGAWLYGLDQIGTLWLVAAMQSLVVAWLVLLLWRNMAPKSPAWTYYLLMAALAALTPLPLVAGFAVPDIFAAAAAMGCVLLIVYRDRLARAELAVVWLILAAAMIFHTSHFLMAAGLIVLGLIVAWFLKAPRKAVVGPAVMIAVALVIANLGMAIYGMGVRMKTGDEYRRPPFLVARVLADGPGRDYLRSSCARGVEWTLCRFRDLPLDDSDEILWSNKAELGVFNRANPEERLKIEKEEPRFVLAVVAHDPLGQFGASMKNWGEQLVTAYVDEAMKDPKVYLRHKYWGHSNVALMYRKVGPCTAEGGCKPRFDWEVLRFLHNGVTLLALSLLVFCLVAGDALQRLRKRDWSDSQSRALAATGLIVGAVIVNAAVCGILSGVFARYQTRIIWLLPAAAGLMVLVLAREGVWSRLWAAVLARLPSVSLPGWVEPAFLRFGVVGACGFTVDAVVLYVLVHGFGVNAYSGRFVSFAVAVMVTWLLNRTFTFRTSGNGGKTREALVYFGVQASGGAANIAVYALALLTVPYLKNALIIPLVMGSAAGLCLTYAGSKHLAFRTAPSRGAETMAAE